MSSESELIQFLSDLESLDNGSSTSTISVNHIAIIQAGESQIQFIPCSGNHQLLASIAGRSLYGTPTLLPLLPLHQATTRDRDCTTLPSRGLSLDLFCLPTSAARLSLEHRPILDLCSNLSSQSAWDVREVAVQDADPATIVMQNQEKLREYSSKRFGTSSEISRGQGPSDGAINPEEKIDSNVRTSDEENLVLLQDILLYVADNKSVPMESFAKYSTVPNVPGLDILKIDPTVRSYSLSAEGLLKVSNTMEDVEGDGTRPSSIVDSTANASGFKEFVSMDRVEVDGIAVSLCSLEELTEVTLTTFDEPADQISQVAEQSTHTPSVFITEENDIAGGGEVHDEVDRLIHSATTIPTRPRLPESVGVLSSWASNELLSDAEYDALRPRMALKYPFELDVFQRQAVMRLERRECVFVGAHTSAGKTVVAEYAIAMGLAHKTRSVYTSPIKALSNQKYRDFKDKFGDVGLITGDISVNPDASCLLMTTEILRSMLYRGADLIRDLEFVIFDEVHYVNDAERGVVWEEVIIMLPDTVNLIFLSATTPNIMEFSDWIGRTKRRKVYVVSTNKRPVPLQHYLLYDNEMYRLMRGESPFDATAVSTAARREKEKSKPKVASVDAQKAAGQRALEKATTAQQNTGKKGPVVVKDKVVSKATGVAGGRTGDVGGGKSQWLNLISVLRAGGREGSGGLGAIDFGVNVKKRISTHMERGGYEKYDKLSAEVKAMISRKEYENMHFRSSEDDEDDDDGGLLPVVVFSFSKKKVEEIADHCRGLDLLTQTEKGEVRALMQHVYSHLNPLDAQLPQVIRVGDMLSRGIGVHHGGLLPILKEAVELLFSKSIVKALFATETFAMGVNMPAKSVVFNGFRKHDGRNFRNLFPGEYTQMAGRAGRRGLDKVGTVVIAAWTELPEVPVLRTLLTGSATTLSSQFRLSYNMILSLLRVNDLSVEDMIKRSFSEFHTQRALTSQDLAKKLRQCEREELIETARLQQADQPEVERLFTFFNAYRRLRGAGNALTKVIHTKFSTALPTIFSAGQAVLVHLFALPCPCVAVVLSIASPASKSIKLSGSAVAPISDIALLKVQLVEQHEQRSPVTNKEDYKDSSVWMIIHIPQEHTSSLSDSSTSTPTPDHDDEHFFTFMECSGWLDSGAYRVMKIPLTAVLCVLDASWKTVSEYSSQSKSLSAIKPGLSAFMMSICIETPRSVDIPKVLKSTDLDLFEAASAVMTTTSLAFITMTPDQTYLKSTSLDTFRCVWRLEELKTQIASLRFYISNQNLALFPDFLQRQALLRTLGYISVDSTVLLKGRVACEMNTCDELLACEMLFDNILEPLNPPEAAGVLAALVFQEKVNDSPKLTTRMEEARALLGKQLVRLSVLQEDFGIRIDDDNRPSLNFGLSAVVYEWARGTSFRDITSMTLVQEGSIVRCITRLDELMKDLRNAARVVGNPSLYRKMEAASQCIRRDIVFAASMYVT